MKESRVQSRESRATAVLPGGDLVHRLGTLLSGSRLWTLVSPLLVLIATSTSAQTQAPKPKLFAELAATSPSVRIGDAMPTIWDIQKFQPGIMEGRFEFRVHLGTVEFYRYTTDELVLHEPDHRFRFLFPPIVTNIVSGEIEVDVAWLDKSGERIPLRMQLLRVPLTAIRTMMIGVAEQRTYQARRPDWDARLQQLPLETLGESQGQVPGDPLGRRAPLQTVFVTWDTEAVPTDPLNFTPYDIVAVAGNVFAALRRPQLDALQSWCLAGGSLYVEPEGLLEPYHVEFLNRLTSQLSDPLAWTMDANGKIDWPGGPRDQGAILGSCDLGRVAIVSPERLEFERMVTAVRHLWYWPADRNPNEVAKPDQPRNQNPWDNTVYQPESPAKERYRNLELALMPASVRLVPLPLIMALLGMLVLLIGPVDWWVLGWLRLRRFTWVTWPCWTIVSALVTVGLSNWYLQTTDVPRTLVLHDVGRDGRVVRTQTFTLTFPSQSRRDTQEVERGVWQQLATEWSPGSRAPVPTGTNAAFMLDDDRPWNLTSPQYSGRVPSKYLAELPVGQWSRQISYSQQIPNASVAERTPMDWKLIDASEWWSAPTFPSTAVSELTRQLGTQPLIATLSASASPTPPPLVVTAPGEIMIGRWRYALDQLTRPVDRRGLVNLSPSWNASPLRHAPLQGLRNKQSVLLVGIRTDETVTVYRRLSP